MESKYSQKTVDMLIEALEVSDHGIGTFDSNDILVFCNKTFANYFGFNSIDDAIGKSFEQILRFSFLSGIGVKADNNDIEGLIKRAKENRLKQGITSFEAERANGKWALVSRVRTDADNIYIYIKDITKLKHIEKELLQQASTDALTSIYNRRYFLKSAELECIRGKRYKYPISILALDIDYFKSINDSYGHLAGDQALIAFSKCCSQLLRENDLFARIGGEEFSILLPHTDSNTAKKIAARILKAIENIKVPYENDIISFTTSIGIAQSSERHSELQTIMKFSDEALYKAKSSGRNRSDVWGEE